MEIKIGDLKIHPIHHASMIMQTPVCVIYVDPVGDPALYVGRPEADIVLLTHEHDDHFSNEVLQAVVSDQSLLISNPGAQARMEGAFASKAQVIRNGESLDVGAMHLDAIPAHNTTGERLKFHPKGRDNGYVLTMGSTRLYLSGDTEDIPEMRALKDIDLAVLCMNLPYTMDIHAAASAVNEFKPRAVVPNHYRGIDGGTQDPLEFAKLLDDDITVVQGDWYGIGIGKA